MFNLSPSPLNPEQFKNDLANPQAGAFAGFEGWVRNRNDEKDVVALEYEAMPALCEKEAVRIMAEVRDRFDILNCAGWHRTGRLDIGEMAVWVGVTAVHRDEAFKACRYIIDEIKHRLPIWKKEFYRNGDSGWVNCQCSSADALVIDLADTMASDFTRYRFIDVRETFERLLNPVAVPHCQHLPFSRFEQWNYDFEQEAIYLIFCGKGARSLTVVKKLHERGVTNVRSVAQGCEAVKLALARIVANPQQEAL